MARNFALQFFFALGLLGAANAHMIMASPVPFDDVKLNDKPPLASDGSDFPCMNSSYKITAMNKIPVNEPVLLSFKGQANHMGGTCQLSISMDEEPDAQSVFKVIQTFQGACPPKDTEPGLTFNIPKEFPTTKRATLQWTWFNNLGNREMYANCAPIEVTGGSNNMDFYNSLPDVFKANIPAADCRVPDSKDAIIPNPGQYIIEGPNIKPGPVTGPKCGTASQQKNVKPVPNLAAYTPPAKDSNQITYVNGNSGGNGGAGGAPSAGAGNPGATQSANNGLYTPSAPAPTQSAPATQSSIASYNPPAGTSSVAAPQPTTLQTKPSAPAYPTLSPSLGQGVSGPTSGSTASPTGSASSSGESGSNSCTQDGMIVCNGPTQFGICNHSSVVWQAVAAGTTCSNGSIQKRHVHVRRHAHGAHKQRAVSFAEGEEALTEASLE